MLGCPLVGLHGGWGARAAKTSNTTMAYSNLSSPAAAPGSLPSGNLQNQNKRKKNGSPLVFEEETDTSTTSATNTPSSANWPRFWIIESKQEDSPVAGLSPFVIDKVMSGYLGTAKVKKLRSGCILVEVSRETQAIQLQNMKTFHNIEVSVSPHRSLNSSKGVVRSYDLAQMDPDELLRELQPQNVVEVRPIFVTKNGTKKRTNTTILTFSQTSPPTSLKAGYLNIRVEQYVPNPLRCFKCQKFGHHQMVCKHTAVCARCGEAEHGEQPCTGPLRCVNCGGEHTSFDKTCPKLISEREVAKIKTTENVSFPEARKIVESRCIQPIRGFSFAMATKTSKKTVGTQTEIVRCECPSEIISPPAEQTPKMIPRSVQMQIQTHPKSGQPSGTNPIGQNQNNPNQTKQTKLNNKAAAIVAQNSARSAEKKATESETQRQGLAKQGSKNPTIKPNNNTKQTTNTPGGVKTKPLNPTPNQENKTWKDAGSDPERAREGTQNISLNNRFSSLSTESMDDMDDKDDSDDFDDTVDVEQAGIHIYSCNCTCDLLTLAEIAAGFRCPSCREHEPCS